MLKIISIASRRLKHNALNCGINVTRRQNIKSAPVSRQFYKIISHRPPHQQMVMKRWQKFHTSYHLMKIETIKVPPFADSISEGDIKFTCKVGDHVKADQVVMEVETDKTTVGVPAPFAGVIKEILVKEGQTVKANQELFKLEAAAGGAAPAPSPSKPAAPAPLSKPAAATPKPAAAAAPKPAVPVAPQPAAASAPQPAVAAAPKPIVAVAPQPAVATPPSASPQATSKPASPAASAPRAAAVPMPKAQPTTMKIPPKDYSREIVGTRTEQRVKMNRMRQKISSRLKDAQNITASLTTFNEIDMSSAMAFRKANLEAFTKQYKTKIGFMSMFSKAAAYALQDQPVINAVIQGDEIVYRDYVDISVAVATPKGLVVPVIRNVESMNFADIEIALAALGDKARKGKITVEDMDGGTFTISNGGVFGSLMGTPIINLPQSSILGMHGIFDRPIAIKKQVVIRPMMYVALTYDHRLIDGREAVLFLRKIKSAVEDPRIMLAGL